MKIKLIKHDIIINVSDYDAKNGVATVKLYGTLCKFQKHEYEIIESE